jgi:hypothetical protein
MMRRLPVVSAYLMCSAALAAEPAPGQVVQLGSALPAAKPPAIDFNTCAKPVWPKHALRMEQGGTVQLAFLVDVDGRVRESKVVKSSGSALLDIAAAEGLAKCTFKAATSNSRPVEAWSKVQYVWTLHGKKDGADEFARHLKDAEQGVAAAQFAVGKAYYGGAGVPKDMLQAIGWLRKAADQGHAQAQEWLGGLLARQSDSLEEAALWMRKAADQGSARAQALYGGLLLAGRGTPQDVPAALDYLGRAADQGISEAQSMLGAYYLKEQPARADEALALLRKAADSNDSFALMVLADLHDRGRHVEQDRAQAIALYSKAAQAGSRAAMLRLADRYERGDGVAEDKVRAAQLRNGANRPPPQ